MTTPITLQSDHLRARIDQTKGSNLVDLFSLHRGEWLPVIARNVPGEDPIANPASFIMAPWCNRIRDAVFVWNNRQVALKPDPRDGSAMHGDVRKRPFTILDRTPISARLRLNSRDFNDVNFPWPFTLTSRFEIVANALIHHIELANTSDEPFPCGCGIHPYFPREQGPSTKHVRIAAPCEGRFPSERCMPIGPARCDTLTRRLATLNTIPAGYQMDSYQGYQGHCEIVWPRTRCVMTSSANHQHMVFFAPTDDRGFASPFFAVEPMTIPANGFNLLAQGLPHHGVTILQPGESLRMSHRFEVFDNE